MLLTLRLLMRLLLQLFLTHSTGVKGFTTAAAKATGTFTSVFLTVAAFVTVIVLTYATYIAEASILSNFSMSILPLLVLLVRLMIMLLIVVLVLLLFLLLFELWIQHPLVNISFCWCFLILL